MTIQDLKVGSFFVVSGVSLAKETGKRLADMGFTQGAQGQLVRRALLGDPLQVAILGYQVSLRKAEASGVQVVLTESPA